MALNSLLCADVPLSNYSLTGDRGTCMWTASMAVLDSAVSRHSVIMSSAF